MNFELKGSVAGIFKWEILTENGSVRESSEWQPNLVLDSGLDYYGSTSGAANHLVAYLHIGTGNSAPTNTQTGLDAPSAVASYQYDSAREYAYDPNQEYAIRETYRYEFGPQSSAYNVSELGLSPSNVASDPMLTRALVKDAQGNPTTISVRANETLIVYYQLRLYMDKDYTNASTQPVNVKGTVKNFNLTARACIAAAGGSSPFSRGGSFKVVSPSNALRLGDSSGQPVQVTAATPSVSVLDTIPSATVAASAYVGSYVAGSYERDIQATLGRSSANYPDGVKGVLVMTSLGWTVFTIEDASDNTKGLVKTDSDVMRLNFKISWGRYTGTIVP